MAPFALLLLAATFSGCEGAGKSRPKVRLVVEPVVQVEASEDLRGIWLSGCENTNGAGGTLTSVRRRSLVFGAADGSFKHFSTQYRKVNCVEPLYSVVESGTARMQGDYLNGNATAVDFEVNGGGYLLHSQQGLPLLKEICPRVEALADHSFIGTLECDGRNPRQFVFHSAFRTEPAYEESILRKMLLIGGLEFVANSPEARGTELPNINDALLQVSENPEADPAHLQ
ncbi:MAG: hypothetical protein IT285_01745 [Bdellovibrionales bacterium]|nr:hypothetical protein [Bdellovibrionales bacterium]